MKIGDVRVIVTSPGRNYVGVKIETEDGTYGVGDATLNGRELAVVGYLSEHVAPLLIGRDAGDIEAIWQYLYRGAYWRRGPVTMAAIAGVDMALWDIKGKALSTPVWESSRRPLPPGAQGLYPCVVPHGGRSHKRSPTGFERRLRGSQGAVPRARDRRNVRGPPCPGDQ